MRRIVPLLAFLCACGPGNRPDLVAIDGGDAGPIAFVVNDAGDAGSGETDGGPSDDAGVCTPESEIETCHRLSLCGTVDAPDNCGVRVRLECEPCFDGGFIDAGSDAGADAGMRPHDGGPPDAGELFGCFRDYDCRAGGWRCIPDPGRNSVMDVCTSATGFTFSAGHGCSLLGGQTTEGRNAECANEANSFQCDTVRHVCALFAAGGCTYDSTGVASCQEGWVSQPYATYCAPGTISEWHHCGDGGTCPTGEQCGSEGGPARDAGQETYCQLSVCAYTPTRGDAGQ